MPHDQTHKPATELAHSAEATRHAPSRERPRAEDSSRMAATRPGSAAEHHLGGVPVTAPARGPRPHASSAPVQFNRGDRDDKGERTKRKQDWRARRDRKQSGKSAGPISEVAETRTKLPLQRDEIAALPQSGKVSAHRIRTVQDTAQDEFSDGTRMMSTVSDIKHGAEIPPIKVFNHKGGLYTLDNRRLYAHRRANKAVSYERTDGKAASKDFDRKFSSKDQGMSMKIMPSRDSAVPYEPEDLEAASDEENDVEEGHAAESDDEYGDDTSEYGDDASEQHEDEDDEW